MARKHTFRQFLHFLDTETEDIIDSCDAIHKEKRDLEKHLTHDGDLLKLHIHIYNKEWSLIHVSLHILRALIRHEHVILTKMANHPGVVSVIRKILNYYRAIEGPLIQVEKLVHLQSRILEDEKHFKSDKVAKYKALRVEEKELLDMINSFSFELYKEEIKLAKKMKSLSVLAKKARDPFKQIAIGARMIVELDLMRI